MKTPLTIEEKKKRFLEELPSCRGIQTLACRRVGFGRTMLKEHKDKDPDFAQKVEEIREGFKDWAESKLLELIEMGDRAAIMFYLKATAKDRGYY